MHRPHLKVVVAKRRDERSSDHEFAASVVWVCIAAMAAIALVTWVTQ